MGSCLWLNRVPPGSAANLTTDSYGSVVPRSIGGVHAPQRGVRFIQEAKFESLAVTNEKASDNNSSRLKMGALGVLMTLLYLWLASSRFGRLGRFLSPSRPNGCRDGQCRDGHGGIFQRSESKFRRARRPFQSLDLSAALGDWSPEAGSCQPTLSERDGGLLMEISPAGWAFPSTWVVERCGWCQSLSSGDASVDWWLFSRDMNW